MEKQTVYDELKKIAKNAYVPYSNFKVACVIYLNNQKKILGVNVENAAYNPTICAERTAISQMITQGYKKDDVKLVALYTDSIEFGSPCGTCRQTLIELLNPSQIIWIFNKNNYVGEFSIDSFLPYSFTNKDLK